ncbi:MAG: 50S ribosomal protein L9 [Patescibacteria group bacterium]|nr:50S ribosomal protein L9 [Patescibacteria group bacterium]
MQIVLLKKVKTLGNPGEVKEVAKGYALNFLIPNGLALPATPGNIKEAKNRARKFDKAAVVDDSAMVNFIKEIEGVEIIISAKTNEKGNLFAAIKSEDIVAEIAKKLSKSIDPEFIVLKEPIKKVGEYEVGVAAGDKKGVLKVKVEAE